MDTDERIARILGAWQDQRDTGESIEPEALVANHPDVAHELAERLAALGFLDLALAGESQPSADAPGRIGDFRILAELGRGGMGVVYEAEQVSMRRKVALKVLSLAITGTPQSVKRFRREAQAAGKLHHTNIVPIYGLGRQGGHWYYAMELVKGRTLSEVIAAMRGAAPTEQRLARRTLAATTSDLVPETGTGTRAYFIRVAEMFAGVADALHLAHQERVIHRDIKPSNLLLDADGTLKIVDFGLALVADGGPAMTMTGDLLGTPAYMSPEQALAKRVAIDHRTDLYSLSATLYEVLTLTAPFAAAGLRELCLQIAWKDPELPRRRDRRIPPDLETIVLRGMEKDRDRRYQSAAELARELRRFAEGVPIHARRIGPVGRTWRRIRRRKVRAALVAAVLLLAIGAGVAAAVAFKERELRHDLEYAKLCASGESYVVRLGPWWLHETAMLQARARERFTRAIAIDPDRPVAYVGRAIAADSLDAALADLERARERGLAPRTYHLARSLSFDTHHKGEEAERERGLAAVEPGGIALDQYIEARILAARGDLDDALECLTRAIELAPHGGTVRFLSLRLRGRLRQEKGDLAGALTDLAGVQAMGDASLDLRLRIASVWRAKGDEKEPERIFEETLREARKSNRPSVWRSLARSCRINAEVAWHERVTIEALKQHPTEPGLLIERAIALEMKSDDNQSEILGLVERALKEAPADHFALVCKGDAQMALHQYSKAVASYRQALLSDKDCFRTLQQLGIALRRIDKPGEALEQFEHALRVKPNDALTFCMKGDALRQNGDYKLAEESYTKAIALDEGESQAYYQRGCLRADNMHRDDDALADFRKALAIDSDHFESQRCCAVIHKKMKQFPEALVEIRKARELKPDSASTYSLEAETLLQWKGIDEALNALDRGVAELPESAELHGMRGAYLCNYRRRFSDAIPDFQKAQELDDQEWTYHAHEAIALRGLGKLRDSIAALDRAIALTNEARPAWLKGEFLLPLAEYEKAAEAYLVAIERDRNGLSPRQGLLHALQAAGSWKRGADAAEEALAKFPADLYLQRSRVRCLRAAGQVDAARTEALRYVDRETPKKERFRFAYLCAAAGDAQRARDTLATMNPDGSAHFGFASVLAAAGEAEDALASLEKAAKSGYRMPLKAVDDPDLDRLLGDRPRYRELMRILRSR